MFFYHFFFQPTAIKVADISPKKIFQNDIVGLYCIVCWKGSQQETQRNIQAYNSNDAFGMLNWSLSVFYTVHLFLVKRSYCSFTNSRKTPILQSSLISSHLGFYYESQPRNLAHSKALNGSNWHAVGYIHFNEPLICCHV